MLASFLALKNGNKNRTDSKQVSPEHLLILLDKARASFKHDFSDMKSTIKVIGLEYAYCKFVRNDNSPEYAKYLGYLDATDLYPDFVPRSFEEFAKELLDGKMAKLFEGESYQW